MILPQALRRLLPPFVSLLVNIIQNSTLAAGDRRPGDPGGGRSARTSAWQRFRRSGIGEIHASEIFGGVAVLFFLISFPLTRLAAMLEKRLV